MAAVLGAAYHWFGRVTLEFSVIERPQVELKGYAFSGRPTQPELEQYFMEMRDKSEFREGRYLTIVSFGTEDNVDTLRQFIGAAHLNAENAPDVYTVPGGKFVSVTLDMTSMFRPSPGRVREEAEEFAMSGQMQLADWNLEIYTGERELTVLFPVQAP